MNYNYYVEELKQFEAFQKLLDKEREFLTLSQILEDISIDDDSKIRFNERLKQTKSDIIELKNSINIFNIWFYGGFELWTLILISI